MKTIPQLLAEELGCKEEYVNNVVSLLDEGNTIPFIARYRKEQHGSMDDTTLRKLEDRLQYLRNLDKRRQEVKSAIDGQGKLTDALAAAIDSAATLAEVEDLYRPYKQKRRTRATVAREKGLEPLAQLLLALCREALEQGRTPQEILSGGLIRGMNDLGEAFSANRAFVPEMLMAARCMTAALGGLKPLMTGGNAKTVGRACIGTVRGDMHDIGKNLVKIMLEGSGVEVIDLGVDVTPEQFVETAKRQRCGVIACSSLLTTTMGEMRRVVTLAREAGIRDQVKIFVGGAPISQSFCDEIGADFYGEDAGASAREAVAILKAQKAS